MKTMIPSTGSNAHPVTSHDHTQSMHHLHPIDVLGEYIRICIVSKFFHAS